MDWLEKHMETHKLLGLGQQRLLVSDDVIESLFGYFKVVVQRSPRAELNRLVYMIPALCGTRSHDQIDQAVGALSHSEMVRFIAEKLPPTLRQQREEVLDALQAVVQKAGKSLLRGGP